MRVGRFGEPARRVSNWGEVLGRVRHLNSPSTQMSDAAQGFTPVRDSPGGLSEATDPHPRAVLRGVLAGPSWLGRPSVVYVQVRVRFWRDDLYYPCQRVGA